MKKAAIFLSIAALTLCNNICSAQGIAINTTGVKADTSAMLDIASTSKGILAPRMTSAQKTAIVTPATGLLIYQTDGTSGFYYYTGSAWQAVSGTTAVSAFNDTLTRNLYTSGYLLTADGGTGINIQSNGLIVDSATYGSGSSLTTSGAGTRMVWYPKKAAFRAGYVPSFEWNDANIGNYSVSLGYGSKVSGKASVGLGFYNTASGDYSTAIGTSNLATGIGAVAIGGANQASGDYSTAIGNEVSTNANSGSFAIGDNSTSIYAYNDAANQMMMRFAGGYKLYTNSAATQGAQLNTSGVWEYMNNVSSSYDARSLVDKTYTDSMAKHAFNDTLAGNLYTNGYLLTADGASGMSMQANGVLTDSGYQTIYPIYYFPRPEEMIWDPGTGSLRAGYASGSQWSAANTGLNSIGLGYNTTVSGTAAVAMGANVSATSNSAVAIGSILTASGECSMALGNYVSTNSQIGSCIIGDFSTTTVTSNSAANQMMMRFAGGYSLYTNSGATIGVTLAANGTSWSTISDRRKKENFEMANGEDFLKKIDTFKLSSWNYKGQDAKLFRHYGPMAQDFFGAFGHDSYGISGNDTTICQGDMEGVSFIAIQALEKRTAAQQKEIQELKEQLAGKITENSELKADISGINKKLDDEHARLDAIEAEIRKTAGR